MTPEHCSSLPVGGIVAGAVVGSIAIVAILVLGWYMIRMQQIRNMLHQNSAIVPPQQSTGGKRFNDNVFEMRGA